MFEVIFIVLLSMEFSNDLHILGVIVSYEILTHL